MKLSRAEFIAQFAIPFHVHCLKLWSRRGYAPPYSVGRCCFEWIGVTNGSVTLKAHEFTELVRPVIDELFRLTPKGQRPDANFLALRRARRSRRRGYDQGSRSCAHIWKDQLGQSACSSRRIRSRAPAGARQRPLRQLPVRPGPAPQAPGRLGLQRSETAPMAAGWAFTHVR